MTIKNANGKAYRLQGPNNLTRKAGKFWNYDNVKYVNFNKYGEVILLEPIKIIEPIIPEETPEEISQFSSNNLINLGKKSLEDNYLNDDVDQEFTHNEHKENSSNQNIDYTIEPEMTGGSPVIYRYTDPYNGTQERKIYVQIEDVSSNVKIFLVSKSERVQNNNIIVCEWDKSEWQITSVKDAGNLNRLISEKI